MHALFFVHRIDTRTLYCTAQTSADVVTSNAVSAVRVLAGEWQSGACFGAVYGTKTHAGGMRIFESERDDTLACPRCRRGR